MSRYLINVVMKIPHQVVIEADNPFEARDSATALGWDVYEAGEFPEVPEEVEPEPDGPKPYYFLRDIAGGSF